MVLWNPKMDTRCICTPGLSVVRAENVVDVELRLGLHELPQPELGGDAVPVVCRGVAGGDRVVLRLRLRAVELLDVAEARGAQDGRGRGDAAGGELARRWVWHPLWTENFFRSTLIELNCILLVGNESRIIDFVNVLYKLLLD